MDPCCVMIFGVCGFGFGLFGGCGVFVWVSCFGMVGVFYGVRFCGVVSRCGV